jgi:hypothetical protein
MNRTTTKLNTLQQLREMVESDIEKVGSAMDDYEGGQLAAFEKVLNNIAVFESIIRHTSSTGSLNQEEPGIDY